MQRLLMSIYVLLLPCVAVAQELGIGLFANPTLTIPVMDKVVDNSPALKAQRSNVNFAGGLNLNLRINKLCIETGGSISTRTLVLKMNFEDYSFNNLNGSSYISTNGDIRYTGFAWSVPVLVGYLLDHHEQKTTYDLYGLLGASYESYMNDGMQQGSSSFNNSITNIAGMYDGIGKSWYSMIVGFKINAILMKVGLIEYGLRYHYPLSNAGNFIFDAKVTNGTYGSAFLGEFYPRLSYLDFHLTYYFLNYKKGEGLKKYKY